MMSFSIQRLLFLRPCRLRFLFFCLPFFAFVLTYVSSVLSKIHAWREEGKFLVNPNANRLFTLPRKRKRLAHRFAIFHVHHDWKDSPRYDTITARAGEKTTILFLAPKASTVCRVLLAFSGFSSCVVHDKREKKWK
jgi:hypothetical protein